MTWSKKLVSLMLLCALCLACASASAGGLSIDQDTMAESYEVEGTVLAELRAEFPQLSGMEDAEAMMRVNGAIRDFIWTEGGFDVACEYAEGDYEYAPEFFDASNYGVVATVQAELLRDDTLLAVRYDFWFNANGAHPWDSIAALHFDLTTGEAVTLEALARDPEALRARVVEAFMQWIAENEDWVFDEAADTVREWPFQQGLMTGEGLLVFYNEGEIAPVAADAVVILIPYDRLDSVL